MEAAGRRLRRGLGSSLIPTSERYALVTGASTGIGRATALRLAAAGYQVFAGVRRPVDGEALVTESARIEPLLLDVTDAKQIASAASRITEAVGSAGLAALVNNAGVAVAAPLEFLPVSELRTQLEINVIGQVAVTQAVLPLLRIAKGRIVNITSIGGLLAGPMLGAYHASKFALEALTDTMRVELAPWGIQVVAVEPGAIATPIWGTSAARSDRMLADSPDASALYGASIEGAKAAAAASAQNGLDPSKVAEVIERALTAGRPRTRYPVGLDAKIGSRVVRRLPDRVRDRFMSARRSG